MAFLLFSLCSHCLRILIHFRKASATNLQMTFKLKNLQLLAFYPFSNSTFQLFYKAFPLTSSNSTVVKRVYCCSHLLSLCPFPCLQTLTLLKLDLRLSFAASAGNYPMHYSTAPSFHFCLSPLTSHRSIYIHSHMCTCTYM